MVVCEGDTEAAVVADRSPCADEGFDDRLGKALVGFQCHEETTKRRYGQRLACVVEREVVCAPITADARRKRRKCAGRPELDQPECRCCALRREWPAALASDRTPLSTRELAQRCAEVPEDVSNASMSTLCLPSVSTTPRAQRVSRLPSPSACRTRCWTSSIPALADGLCGRLAGSGVVPAYVRGAVPRWRMAAISGMSDSRPAATSMMRS